MALVQAKRLAYTRRDLLSIHDDVTQYWKEYIPIVTDASEMNPGRLLLTIHEALIDNANYSIDQNFLETQLSKARQRKNILRLAYMIDYAPTSVSTASVDLTVSMLNGVAPSGGQAIPLYTRFRTISSPVTDFLSIEAATITEGETSVSVSAIQGIRVNGETLTAAATGAPNQKYTISSAKTPHSLIEVYVNGKLWTNVQDFSSSDEESEHYRLEYDEDDYTQVIFGDDEFGKAPDSGSNIGVNYVYTDADEGNVSAETITKVVGALASTVGVTNENSASGGAVSETNESIKRNAPASRRSFDRAVTKDDYEALATAMEGVYKSFAIRGEGARTDIYLLPEGGGVASSYLISTVQDELNSVCVDGAIPVVDTLQEAGIYVAVNIVTFSNRITKASVKRKVIDVTNENLDYTKLTRGRAFTLSDLSGIYEALEDGELVDFADFTILSRIPRVVKSNAAAPDFYGRVSFTTTAGYNTYLVTALSTTQFSVSKDGTPQMTQGTVATAFTTDNNEVTFTLGESGDTLTIGDTWTFKTSRYVDNIVIDDNEVMTLEKSSDLVVSVFFPGEYDIKTKSAA